MQPHLAPHLDATIVRVDDLAVDVQTWLAVVEEHAARGGQRRNRTQPAHKL
jgi:hypothetical protein